MNWNRVSYLLAILLGCVCLLSPGCSKKGSDDEEATQVASVDVSAAKVQQGAIRRIIQSGGTLNALPNQDVKISALISGRVTQILVGEGDPVSAGQLLARLDDSTVLDQLKQAEAGIENAKSNAERTAKLYDRGIASGKEKEDAQKEYVNAQASLHEAQVQVSRSRIESPIRGVVVKRFVSMGEQVDGTSAQPLVEVASFDPIELTASLQTSFLSLVHQGQDVQVRTDAYGERDFPGKIFAILPSVDPASNAATLRIRISNPQGELKGGMFAQASILAEVHQDALYVPASAIVASENESRVYVVGPDSKAKERQVKTGLRDGDRVEILEGVRKDELVVTTGSYGLADGMTVKIHS